MKRLLKIAGGVLLGVAALGYAGWRYVTAPYSGPEIRVELREGLSRNEVRDVLTSTLGTWGGRAFAIYDRVADEGADPRGSYLVADGEKAKDFARRLVQRRQNPVRVTFNNVRTMAELADKLDGQLMLTGEEFLAACDSVLPGAGFKKPEYIAAFLPDTYEFYWTSAPVATVERLLAERNKFWNDDRRAQAKAMGLTPVQTATLASIAEEETNDRAERATVARLYLNRVHRGMPLQADPTVKFAVGDFGLRRILAKHLAVESPYNTYKRTGLPPGPIRMAERATMQSLLDSRAHPYIYMCAKPDFSGRHLFTASYAEHQRNAAAYHHALNARGVRGR